MASKKRASKTAQSRDAQSPPKRAKKKVAKKKRAAKKKTAKKKTSKRPVGRPSKYKQEYCKMLVDHLRVGDSYETFPATIYEKYGYEAAVHVDTLYEWEKVHPEFSEAKKIGWALGRKFWEQLGKTGSAGRLERTSKEIIHPDGKVEREKAQATFGQSAWIFTMKNRFNYRDRVDLNADVTQNVTTSGALEKILQKPGVMKKAMALAEEFLDEDD